MEDSFSSLLPIYFEATGPQPNGLLNLKSHVTMRPINAELPQDVDSLTPQQQFDFQRRDN